MKVVVVCYGCGYPACVCDNVSKVIGGVKEWGGAGRSAGTRQSEQRVTPVGLVRRYDSTPLAGCSVACYKVPAIALLHLWLFTAAYGLPVVLLAGGGKQRRQDWKRDRQHQHRGGPGGREWQQRRGPGGYGASGEGPKHGGAERRQDGREGGKGQGGEGADGGKKRKERAEDGAAAAGAPGGGEGQGTERGSKKARKEQNGGGRQEQQRSEEDRQEKEHGRRGQDRAHKKDKPHKKELDPEAARLASYAVPTLKKESDKAQYGGSGGQGGKKRKRGADGGSGDGGGGGAQAPPSDGPQLTRAQKKNLKRTQKRAVKRQGAAEGA